MLCPFSLHLSALFRFMAPYDAARSGPKQSVMDGVMTGDASYESTFKAAFSIGRCHCRQSQNIAKHLMIARIFAPKLQDSFRATTNKAGYDDVRINTIERSALPTEWCNYAVPSRAKRSRRTALATHLFARTRKLLGPRSECRR
jgi:hypothetical protein